MTPAFDLSPVTSADVDDVHRLFGDAATWQHLPSGRHTDLAAIRVMVEAIEREWAGVSPRDGTWWNVGYRFAPVAWGKGLAVMTTLESVSRARALRPGWPVVSRLLSNNPASERASRRLGLDERWRGPSSAAPGVDRLILADRELEAGLLRSLVGLG